jgi:protein-tyrosine phosphatase
MKFGQWAMVANRWAAGLRGQDALTRAGETPALQGAAAVSTWIKGALGMDLTWVTGRIAVGGGIWMEANMAAVARAGVTHIIDMQKEFDDTGLAKPYGIRVLWIPVDDDFKPKPPEIFQQGVDFAREALDEDGSKLLIHCAAGIHRAPMMALGVLCSLSWKLEEAKELIQTRRPTVEFLEIYVNSVERFLARRTEAGKTVGRLGPVAP